LPSGSWAAISISDRPRLAIRFDLRAPASRTPAPRLYAAALDMAAWADRHRFDLVRISEHHGAEDGYCPAPIVFASAAAGRTRHSRIRLSALLLPLHDPVRMAEDLAVADLVSRGRLEVICGAGYRAAEFAMFGADRARRGLQLEESIGVLRAAWTGRPFEHRGRTIRVLPTPAQDPHPPLLLGGSSRGAARRAARLGLGFVPTDPRLNATYRQACEALGLEPPAPEPTGPSFLYVTDDPERAWHRLLPYLVHEAQSYASWLEPGRPLRPDANVAATIKANAAYQVVTPDECLALALALGPRGQLLFHPLVSGLDPDHAWPSLELFAARVLPALVS
jgi:alkanesulfonate monooxygenase SsuD/methylene tetrahydromethanopterin reductase-like flavin-dependent oxidoreductase (luciferase family)